MSRLDQIWNGWRAEYVSGVTSARSASTDTPSVFTQILNSGLDDSEANIVHRGDHCFVLLNAFPYTVGHLLVLPYRQVANIEDLNPDESSELWALVGDGVIAVKTAYRPDGVNVGINLGPAAGGSVSEHLHVHVLGRWVGDSNFITSVANARTIPEPLDQTAARLRAAWPISH